MSNLKIQWRCYKCGRPNWILYPFKAERHFLVDALLSLALCEHCGKAREPRTVERYKYNWKCPHCGLFPPFVIRKGGYCQAYYMQEYLKQRKVKTAAALLELGKDANGNIPTEQGTTREGEKEPFLQPKGYSSSTSSGGEARIVGQAPLGGNKAEDESGTKSVDTSVLAGQA